MRLILDRALFAPQSDHEALHLVRLLSLVVEDLHPHALQTDPAYLPGADNGEIDVWLLGRPEAGVFRQVLTYGNLVAARSRGVPGVDPAPLPRQPTPLPRWRVAGAFDVRVERRAVSEWGALRLTLADAVDLLREPVHLVLENARHDLAFVCHLSGPTDGPVLRKLEAAPGRLHVHGGGSEAKPWLEALIEEPVTAEKWRRLLRTWVLFDQDSGDHDACEPSGPAEKMVRVCEKIHAKFQVGLSWICLCRREIESYVPDSALAGPDAETLEAHAPLAQQVIAWRADPAHARYAWAFDLKKGLYGDILESVRNNLPEADRKALKSRIFPLTAAMLKAPFDTLTPAEVAALSSWLGDNLLNKALGEIPTRPWTAGIPAEYDRGPSGQAPREAFIQSLFDRV